MYVFLLVVNVQIQEWVGGSAQIRALFGSVNPYELLDDPLIATLSVIFQSRLNFKISPLRKNKNFSNSIRAGIHHTSK